MKVPRMVAQKKKGLQVLREHFGKLWGRFGGDLEGFWLI